MQGSSPVDQYLNQIRASELLVRLTWDQLTTLEQPYPTVDIAERELLVKFERYGYDWDMHGTLYEPESEVREKQGIVLIHGGGVNEMDFRITPDGRPGLGPIAASLGFKVLVVSYPGLWPPGGVWKEPVAERRPYYVLDRKPSEEEHRARMLRATFPLYMQGIASLTEEAFEGYGLFVHGHSTGGRMAMHLNEYLKTNRVSGILGWGSGGPDSWRTEWKALSGKSFGLGGRGRPLDSVLYRTVAEYRDEQRYEDAPDLTPWGNLEDRFRLVASVTPCFNTNLQMLSHQGAMQDELERYAVETGLPLEEFIGHINGPNESFLRTLRLLLLVGENDYGHWVLGEDVKDKFEFFVAKRYSEITLKTRLVLVPRFTHMGHWALYNERIVYLWLWAIRDGYFDA